MAESEIIFLQLAVVLGLAAVFGYVVKSFRLPVVVAYLLTGVFLSFVNIFDATRSQALTFLPDIGVAFLLFLVGMELDLNEIKNLGRPILVAGLGQIGISIGAGFLIADYLGFSSVVSFYFGVGLAFSSTIVVVKLLAEKKDLNSLYGKLSLGITLLEDLVAVVVLMGMTLSFSHISFNLAQITPLINLFAKGALMLFAALFLSRFVLLGIFKAVAQSQELLFLASLAWCFIFVAISVLFGFSIVVGAFLAGVALASSPFHYEIEGKMKPLRDFFVALFFVYIGSQVVFGQIVAVLPIIIIFSLYALVIKPIIFLLILGAFGFRKHTIFQTGLSLSPISEFSLIIMVFGLKMGVVNQQDLTAMAVIGVVTIIISSINISFSRQIYKFLSPFVGFFERKDSIHYTEDRNQTKDLADHVILIGAHRMGGEIVKFLEREHIPFLVVDFNPEVVQRLVSDRIKALYGDISDPEVLEFLSLERAKIIISTANDLEDNLVLISEIKNKHTGAIILVRASSVKDAKILYQRGASYVILPEIVSGDFITQLLKEHWSKTDFFKNRPEIEMDKLSRSSFAA